MPLAGSSAVAAAAVRGWALLLTTAPRHALRGVAVEAWLAALAELLHASNVSLRTAAGQSVTLLLRTAGLAALSGADSGLQPSLIITTNCGCPQLRKRAPTAIGLVRRVKSIL